MQNIAKNLSLPEFYYLGHATELFEFVKEHCDHLLLEEHRDYVLRFLALPRNEQALQTRILSRKPKILSYETLEYEEIFNTRGSLSTLRQEGFIDAIQDKDAPAFINCLSKAQLQSLLAEHRLKSPSGGNKQAVVDHTLSTLKTPQIINSEVAQQYITRRQQTTVDYIFYLFFGRLGQQFQRFVMRDLGLMRTRKSKNQTSRFKSKDEALICFKLANHLSRVKQISKNQNPTYEEIKEIAEEILTLDVSGENAGSIIGEQARQIADELLLQLGRSLEDHDSDLAIRLWKKSNKAEALEKWVRLSYKLFPKPKVESELQRLRDEELAEEQQIFVEDFYARKYQGKRTSVFTDMLRESEQIYQVDEVYQGDVEQGVMNHHIEQGRSVFFTENHFWRTLFGLSLWNVLYNDKQESHSEFDLLPSCLRRSGFYQTYEDQIEQCLEQFNHSEELIKTLLKRCTSNYGYITGVFRWRDGMLDPIIAALKTRQANSLGNVVRLMAQNYRHSKDGYPDLMVIEDQELRFEEIKAPGDVLRPNQLLSINRLRKAGIVVDIAQVQWSINPAQKYAVVDIETTGSRRSGSAITEIAIVTVRNGEIISEWSSLINPQRRVPRHITQLTGIDNSMVANAPLFSELADQIEAKLQGCIFVAHNVGFDYGFIKEAFSALDRSFKYPKLCTVQQSRKTFPGLRSYSLAALTEHFDIDLKGHHRALNDARATAHLLRLIHAERCN